MFIVYFQKDKELKRYFNSTKGLQKTIKTATVMNNTYLEQFQELCKKNPLMFIQTINVSDVAEMMYDNVQYNQIRW